MMKEMKLCRIRKQIARCFDQKNGNYSAQTCFLLTSSTINFGLLTLVWKLFVRESIYIWCSRALLSIVWLWLKIRKISIAVNWLEPFVKLNEGSFDTDTFDAPYALITIIYRSYVLEQILLFHVLFLHHLQQSILPN